MKLREPDGLEYIVSVPIRDALYNRRMEFTRKRECKWLGFGGIEDCGEPALTVYAFAKETDAVEFKLMFG